MSDPILHVRRDDLRPEVRSYADNLKAQILDLYRQLEIKDAKEVDRLVAEKKVRIAVVQKMKDLLAEFAATVKRGEIPEGEMIVERVKDAEKGGEKEVRLDLKRTLAESRHFFESHGLGELAALLPREVVFSATDEMRVREGMRFGLDKAFVFPPDSEMLRWLDRIYRATTGKDAPYYDIRNRRRPDDQPYVLLYYSGPPVRNFAGLPQDVEAAFEKHDCVGLTFTEYLLLQDREAKAGNRINFDDLYAPQSSGAGHGCRTLLLDACYFRGGQRMVVWWDRYEQTIKAVRSGGGALGVVDAARPAMVIPL